MKPGLSELAPLQLGEHLGEERRAVLDSPAACLGAGEAPLWRGREGQQSGFGGVVSFVVEGGKEAAWKLIDSTNLFSITANLGDAKSTITHPATTTHNRLTDEERQSAGIEAGLIRLSIGFEDAEDLQADLSRGLST